MLPRPPITPVMKILMIGLFSAFVTQIVLERFVGIDVLSLLAVTAGMPTPFSIVQLFTHVLVNQLDPTALVWMLIGLLFLWWVGAPFELRVGAKQTWMMTGVGTVSSGVGTMIAGLVLPGYAIGAGPIIDALIVGFAATLPPHAQLSLFGVVPMKRNGLILLLVGFVVLGGVLAGNFAGIVGDLTCIAASWGYMTWLLRPRRPKPRAESKPATKRRKDHGFRVIQGGGTGEDDDDDDKPRWLN